MFSALNAFEGISTIKCKTYNNGRAGNRLLPVLLGNLSDLCNAALGWVPRRRVQYTGGASIMLGFEKGTSAVLGTSRRRQNVLQRASERGFPVEAATVRLGSEAPFKTISYLADRANYHRQLRTADEVQSINTIYYLNTFESKIQESTG